jgi:hypothetical protein
MLITTYVAVWSLRVSEKEFQERSMKQAREGFAFRTVALRGCALVIVAAVAWQAQAQDAKTPYPKMAPVEQYMMEPSAEIALALSAAPPSISQDAEVMVMGRHGYEVAVKGKNGFVCMVERGWTAGVDDPVFWNPKIRGPICFNPPAARFNVPITVKKTELVLAGRSKEEMAEAIKAAFDKKELPTMGQGAMCYMLSKQGYLSDSDGHWRPHLMFFVPDTDPEAWGAGLAGSPVIGFKDTLDRFTLFMIPVGKWSDGTVAEVGGH